MDPRTPHLLLRRLMIAALVFLAGAAPLWAAVASFPRGPGLYYSPFKLAILIASFWGWVRLATWLDEDANNTGMEVTRWNLSFLGTGVLAALVVWGLPLFYFAMFFFWAAVFGITGLYIYFRNQEVGESDQLLTREHLYGLLDRAKTMLGRSGGGGEADAVKNVPIRFMARTTSAAADGDHRRIERVQQSRGYKAAQEMVYEAIQKRATDIHMEPTEDKMLVRLRIDGMMSNAAPFARSMGEAVINIFKVLSNLDITERRKPQDGSYSAQVGKQTGPGEWRYRLVDFRVATAGSVVGEKMVMRILDSSAQMTDLSQIGMPDAMRERIHDIVTRPHGMFLVCGPTGSGKSTTLYACLHEIDRFGQNVITIENPVEYRLDNVTQIEVNPKAGKTFASELRSILRQDPDVIMVGEIRDKETAEIACQAAQTGHMVFSTVHANDTVTALGRLIDLGVQPFMVGSALTAVLGQRLVRRLCPRCRVRFRPQPELLKRLKADPHAVRYLYRAPDTDGKKKDEEEEEEQGVCDECGGSGYCRRTGIFELLVINDAIREQIRAEPDLNAIRQEASRAGMLTLFEDGARLVIEGDTSIHELLRVAK
jgi:type II secretory ATPase GspE/PulE/Tfp pilus assembly ATPase PilB-like protein